MEEERVRKGRRKRRRREHHLQVIKIYQVYPCNCKLLFQDMPKDKVQMMQAMEEQSIPQLESATLRKNIGAQKSTRKWEAAGKGHQEGTGMEQSPLSKVRRK